MSEDWAARQPITERISAAEAVFADLKNAILGGYLHIGERLPSEAALAERHSVSRSVVREALRSCAALGLTETKTGKGTFVVNDRIAGDIDIGEYSTRDLIEARPHVEIPAAGLAAQRRTPDDLATLTKLTEAMRDHSDHAAWVRLDASFHLAIARASGNRIFETIIGDIREAMTRQSTTLNLAAGRMHRSNDEHDQIVSGIRAGDYEYAAAAMSAHLNAVHNAVSSLVHD